VIYTLTARQVHLVVLEGPFAHTSPLTSGGKLLYAIFAALAEFERDLIRDRVVAGLAAARTRGRKGGGVRSSPLSNNGWLALGIALMAGTLLNLFLAWLWGLL